MEKELEFQETTTQEVENSNTTKNLEQETEPQEKTKKELKAEKLSKRIWEIDLIRGICIILMIFDHFMFDIFYYCDAFVGTVVSYNSFLAKMVDFGEWYWNWSVRRVVRTIVVFMFFCLSGICSNFSKSNIKRGLITLAVAYGLTLGTIVFSLYEVNGVWKVYYRDVIWFGVLHCLGYSMLVTGIIQKFKADGKASMLIGAIVIATIGIVMICLKTSMFDLAYGILGKNMMMTKTNDFFPIFPYMGIFFFGSFIGKVLYDDKQSMFARGDICVFRPIKFIGRHAIWFYLGHQGLFISIIMLLQMIYL